MIRTQALIDFAVVIYHFLGSLMDLIDFLLLLGQKFIVFCLDIPHGFIELVGAAMQVLQQWIMVMGKVRA